MSRVLETVAPVNSLSYADLLGVLVGLERLPEETSDRFLDRVHRAAASQRGSTYIGLINEISLQLDLPLYHAIQVHSSYKDYSVSVGLKGVRLSNSDETVLIPLLTIGDDDFWQWRTLLEVVEDINRSNTFTAELLSEDAPALQLAWQSNTFTFTERISGRSAMLTKQGLVVGSESFTTSVPGYTVGGSLLHFDSPVPDGTEITYQYRIMPTRLVASPICLISLKDPDIKEVGMTSGGVPVYQLREMVHQLASVDRSYWAR